MSKTFQDYTYAFVKRINEKCERSRIFAKKGLEFIERSHNSQHLLLIVAGFQDFYWDAVFERVEKNQTQISDLDVCIVVPGADGTRLKKYAEDYGWSYLHIEQDLLAQAQNTAIKLHPYAKWIFKIDEDILLSDHYFEKMLDTYQRAEKSYYKRIGFLAPLINLNAGGIKIFLETVDAYDEYKERFGKSIIGLEDPIHKSPEVAEFIWKQSISFDKVANIVESKNRGKFCECNVRFSVGAVLFTRDYWKKLGGFIVKAEGIMAAEEEQMNAFCFNNMLSIILSTDTFVGHLGFWKQKDACHSFYLNHEDEIRLPKTHL